VTTLTAGGAHRGPGAIARLAGLDQPDVLRRVRRAGYLALGLQLVGFMVWSQLLWRRFALTIDFAEYENAWFLIAHGHLDPMNSVGNGAFWQNHAEFIMWPLAGLYWVWPHQVTLLWIQDIGVVLAEAAAFRWLCELAADRPAATDAAWLSVTGLLLLLLNPWTWWSVSFDFHTESLYVPLLVLLARDLMNGRARAWVWVGLLVSCGDVADTYLAGLGLTMLLIARGRRRAGAVLVGAAVAATGLITLIHGNLGSAGALHSYAYLAGSGSASLTATDLAKGIVTHPQNVLRALWEKRTDIWASLAPAGVVGLAFAWILPIALIILAEDNLTANLLFTRPSFQSLALYVLVPVGTVWLLARLGRRHRLLAAAAACVLVVQAAGWALVWGPQVRSTWLRVPPTAAAELARISADIPPTATVVAFEVVVGRFSGRDYIGAATPGSQVRARGVTWFVLAPRAGVEVQSVAGALGLIGDLAGGLHARLQQQAAGVWAFRLQAPASGLTIRVPATATALPAWAAAGAAGRPVLTGPAPGWHAVATGARGYVVSGLEWLRPAGAYVAAVRLSSSGPVNVEVWDNTGNVLLSRRTVPATAGAAIIRVPVPARTSYQPALFSGWGPFRARFLSPPPGQRLELRVWSSGAEAVSVYTASLTPAAP
jgi:Predicted membrane protein (DUF2079)